jgi:hypothetical protein
MTFNPDETLAEIRDLSAQDHRSELARDDVGALLDRVEALDEWLSTGGALPAAWSVRQS